MALNNDLSKNTELLQQAAFDGNTEEVKRLIPISDPKANNSMALSKAAQRGHVNCVRLLIPVSEANGEDCKALEWSVSNNRKECVEMLIPYCNPKANNSYTLSIAAFQGSREIAELLIPHSNVEAAKTWCDQKQKDYLSETVELMQSMSTKQGFFWTHEISNKSINEMEVKIDKMKLSEAIGLDASSEQAPVKKRKM